MVPQTERRPWLDAVVGAAIACAGVFGASALGAAVGLGTGKVPVSGVAAALVGVLLCTFVSRAPRYTLGVSLGAGVGLAPCITFGVASTLREPLVATSRCGMDTFGLVLLAPVAIVVGCALAVPLAALADWVGGRAPRVFVTAGAGLWLVAALVTLAACTSLRRPEPDDLGRLYARTTELAVGKTAFIDDSDVTYEPKSTHESCRLRFASVDGPRYVWVGEDEPCPHVDVLAGPGLPTLFVRRDEGPLVGRVVTMAPDRPLFLRDLPGRFGAPRGWLASAAFALLLGAWALARALAALRAERRLRRTVEADHTGGGWVTLRGAPYHVAGLERSPSGPVVLELADERAPGYRETGSPAPRLVARGRLEDTLRTARARAAAWACAAAVTIVLGSAPLVVARAFQLF